MATTIFLITGATGTGKTHVATKFARAKDALVLPIDQLHLYSDMEKGTGLDPSLRDGLRSFGYQMLSPWIRFSPSEYVQWLRQAILNFANERFIVIEGGCTSYLYELVARQHTDPVLKAIRIMGMTFDSDKERLRDLEKRISFDVFDEVVDEVVSLREKAYYNERGVALLRDFEKQFKHPEQIDPDLAWSLRISAGVYYPAHLASVSELSRGEARARLMVNVSQIQMYQDHRIRSLLQPALICNKREVKEYLSQV